MSYGSSDAGVPAATVPTEARAGRIGLVLGGHYPLMLHGLSHVFATETDCAVLAVCRDADTIVETVRRHLPDVVVLDFDRSDTVGLLRRIRHELLSVRVVVLAASSEHQETIEAMELGASAVVLKKLPPEALLSCIRSLHRGEQSAGAGNGRGAARKLHRATSMRTVTRQLTPREAQIARLAVQGVSTSEIATRLAVKRGTVKIHLHSIYTKLKVSGRLGLIVFARRHGAI